MKWSWKGNVLAVYLLLNLFAELWIWWKACVTYCSVMLYCGFCGSVISTDNRSYFFLCGSAGWVLTRA